MAQILGKALDLPGVPSCGRRQRIDCSACSKPMRTRQRVQPDFIIGAHRDKLAEQLITRDRGYYRTYFPRLRLV